MARLGRHTIGLETTVGFVLGYLFLPETYHDGTTPSIGLLTTHLGRLTHDRESEKKREEKE